MDHNTDKPHPPHMAHRLFKKLKRYYRYERKCYSVHLALYWIFNFNNTKPALNQIILQFEELGHLSLLTLGRMCCPDDIHVLLYTH